MRTALIGRKPRSTIIRVAVLIVTSLVVFGFILRPTMIKGLSMEPTFKDHSFNFINRLAYLFHEPRRGDIVGISYSEERITSVMLCKRIIGLPGETVEFAGGRVLINGQVLAEPYLKNPCNWSSPPVKLSPDQYYVVGDNRSMPIDDHYHGSARRGQIVGKMLL